MNWSWIVASSPFSSEARLNDARKNGGGLMDDAAIFRCPSPLASSHLRPLRRQGSLKISLFNHDTAFWTETRPQAAAACFSPSLAVFCAHQTPQGKREPSAVHSGMGTTLALVLAFAAALDAAAAQGFSYSKKSGVVTIDDSTTFREEVLNFPGVSIGAPVLRTLRPERECPGLTYRFGCPTSGVLRALVRTLQVL
eukprot:scaffold1541_cov256-Pinguiococcus_pyrenoidosus.AAC.35